MSAAAAMHHPGHCALRAPLPWRHHPRRGVRRGGRALTSPSANHIPENFERNAHLA